MSVELIKEAMASPDRLLCKRYNLNLTKDACDRYIEGGRCSGCDQRASGIPMAVKPVKKCKTCDITNKKLSNGECPSCAGKSRRAKEKERKMSLKDVNQEKQSVDDNFQLVLDFNEYPELLAQVRIKAKEEFRNPEQQMLAWAWEVCGNNCRPKG